MAIVFVVVLVQSRVCGDQIRYKKCYFEEHRKHNAVCSTRPPMAVYFQTPSMHVCAFHCNRYNSLHVHNADDDDAMKQKIFSPIGADGSTFLDRSTNVTYNYNKQLDLFEFEQKLLKSPVHPWIDYSQHALNVKCFAFNYEASSKSCLLFDAASDYQPSIDATKISLFYENVIFSDLYTNTFENERKLPANLSAPFSCSFHQV